MTKLYKFVVICTLTIFFCASQAYAGINITSCGYGIADVVTTAAKGKFIGFSVRTSKGKIIDVPHQKMKGWVGTYGYIFKYSGKNITEARASTWEKYNKSSGLMENRRADTGWVKCK